MKTLDFTGFSGFLLCFERMQQLEKSTENQQSIIKSLQKWEITSPCALLAVVIGAKRIADNF